MIYLFGIIAIVVIIMGVFYNDKAQMMRVFRRTIHRNIAGVKEGDTVKISGQIKYLGNTLIAPLSGRKCVYYHIIVEQKTSSANHSDWRTFFEEEVAGDVVLHDGENYAIIKTGKVKSYLVKDANYRSGFLNDATENLENYLNSKGHESEDFLGLNRTLRYKEGILEEGEQVTVVGRGQWQKKIPKHFNILLEEILLITSNEANPVYFSDDPDII